MVGPSPALSQLEKPHIYPLYHRKVAMKEPGGRQLAVVGASLFRALMCSIGEVKIHRKDLKISTPPDLNILQVCLSRSWGGLEMTALEQTQWLMSLGHKVLNVVRPGSPLQQQLSDVGAAWVGARSLFSLARVRGQVTAFGPDLIVYQQLRDLTFHRLYFPLNIPTVGFLHMFLKVKKLDPWHRFHYAALDRLVVLTQAQKINALEHLPVTRDRIDIIPNGVDTEKFHPSQRDPEFKTRLGLEQNTFLVGVVGRFDPQKGQMETLEALRKLHSQHPSLRVAFIGEDTLNSPGTKSKMKDFIRANGLESKAFILPFQADIASVMASLDLFLMPSYGETFGRVLIEAMACSVPVIGTRAGGVVSLIDHGKDGLLIEPQSSRAIAGALTECLTGKHDLTLLGDQARKKAVAQFDQRWIHTEILNLYQKAAKISE